MFNIVTRLGLDSQKGALSLRAWSSKRARWHAQADAQEEDPPVLHRPGRSQRYESLAQLRALVVDDDLRTREAVREVLVLTGLVVELAASAAEGMQAIIAFDPQLILSDLGMPIEDGYTFIRRVRAREAGKRERIPAMALTAFAHEDSRRRALAAGYQMHLAKPVDLDRLREALLELATMRAEPKP